MKCAMIWYFPLPPTTADPVDPGDIKPVSNIFPESSAEELRPDVAVCGAMSLLVQVTLEPLETVAGLG